MISQYFIGGMMPELANPVQQPQMIIESWLSSAFLSGRSAAQAPLSRKRKSISRTVSGLTGKIQSPGVEKQPGVEHLICKARSPLVPPTTSIWRPEIILLQLVQ